MKTTDLLLVSHDKISVISSFTVAMEPSQTISGSTEEWWIGSSEVIEDDRNILKRIQWRRAIRLYLRV